jgi:hypothetical protein
VAVISNEDKLKAVNESPDMQVLSLYRI